MASTLKVLILGANGMIGQAVRKEAEARGLRVTAASRQSGVDANDLASISKALEGQDVVVVAIAPHRGPPVDGIKHATLGETQQTIFSAIRKVNKNIHVLWVGGAGSLLLPTGGRVIDSPDFPKIYLSEATQQVHTLEAFKNGAGDVNWTFFCPALEIAPGAKTGKVKLGDDHALFDAEGKSHITNEDYAAVLVDEIIKPTHHQKRFTAINV